MPVANLKLNPILGGTHMVERENQDLPASCPGKKVHTYKMQFKKLFQAGMLYLPEITST